LKGVGDHVLSLEVGCVSVQRYDDKI